MPLPNLRDSSVAMANAFRKLTTSLWLKPKCVDIAAEVAAVPPKWVAFNGFRISYMYPQMGALADYLRLKPCLLRDTAKRIESLID